LADTDYQQKINRQLEFSFKDKEGMNEDDWSLTTEGTKT
jgi:hypothetical protein